MKTRPRDIWRFLKDTRVYTPQFNPSMRYILKSKWDLIGRIDSLFCPEQDLGRYNLFVNERILELPFAHRMLDRTRNGHILEFGCANSTLSFELASRGLLVTGVDLRPYPLDHPNLTFCQGDFFDQNFSEAPFDAIVAISAVEHVGLGAYGENKRQETADRRLLDTFHTLLCKEGQLILTVPFGSQKITPRYRIYDSNTLASLLQKYVIENEEYYRRFDHSTWIPITPRELEQIDWHSEGPGSEGVALIAARRKESAL